MNVRCMITEAIDNEIWTPPSAFKVPWHATAVGFLPTTARLLKEKSSLVPFWVIKRELVCDVAILLVCGRYAAPWGACWKKKSIPITS